MSQLHDYFHALLPETSLHNGAFVLREAVGRGGTSFTYRALDVRLGREVAIKEWFPPGATRDDKDVRAPEIEYSNRAAFVEEARALARFDHPHIVRVFAVFEQNESAYIVEEFLHGHTLQHVLEHDGAFSVDEALRIIKPVCDATETLHLAGLVHGDIKPANIMRTQSGRVVLLDFGLTASLPQSEYATTLLAPQRGVGTSGYAPLEQYSKQGHLTPASDVYALSATLWQLLTNELPPDAPGRASGVALPNIRSLVPQISEDVARALEHGLAMNARERPQTVRAWWNELSNELSSATETLVAPTPSTRSNAVSDVGVNEDLTPVASFIAPQSHNQQAQYSQLQQQLQQSSQSSTQLPSHAHQHSHLDVPEHSIWALVFLSCSLFALMVALLLMS